MRRWRTAAARRCAASGLSLLLAGCLQPTRPPPAPTLPPQFAQALRRPAEEKTVASSERGWATLGNPALVALIERALARGASIDEARWRLVAARQLAAVAAAPFRPTLRLHTVSSPNVESTASYLQAGFDSQWEFGLFGKSDSELRLAGVDAEQAAIAVDAARLSLASEIVRDYLEVGAADASRRLAAASAAAQQRQRDLIASRRRLGLATTVELDEAETTLSQARTAEAAAVDRADATRQRLAFLVAGEAAAPLRELDTEVSPVNLVPSGGLPLPAHLLERRPDLRAAELAVRKAAAELDAARAERWPQIALVGELTYAAKIDGDELLKPRRIAALGPAINLPLFDWGMRRARADARGAELAAASAAFRRVAEDAVAETETALAALAAAENTLALDESTVERRSRSVDTVVRRRALGWSDALDVVQAEIDLLQARTARAQAAANRDLAALAVLKSLGGPTGGPT